MTFKTTAGIKIIDYGIDDSVCISKTLSGCVGCSSYSFSILKFKRGMSKRQYRRKQLKELKND